MDNDDITAVYLYNRLERDPECRVDDEFDLKHQVAGILDKNFQRTRRIRNALLDWTEHCDMVVLASSSHAPIECEEYEDLIGLGYCIIPQVMVQYDRTNGPLYAYELLHELMGGYRTGQMTIGLGDQYRMWAEWFGKGRYEDAPHYRRPEGSE